MEERNKTWDDPHDGQSEQGIWVWEENHARGLSLEQMENPNFERQAEDRKWKSATKHGMILMTAKALDSDFLCR